LIKAHRSSVLWTLNDRLAKTSASLTDLQEERSRRREERNKSLGGQAAKETSWFEGITSGLTGQNGNEMSKPIIPSDEPSIESQLSPVQLQALESENSALLENMESTLSSVLSAERSLLEISSLQTELVKNLVQQTEITDRLYEEAVGSEEGRMFLLIFLLGASLALLFLDWYAA
jgi:syntaxin 18